MKRTVSYLVALFLGLFVGWLGQQFWIGYTSIDSSAAITQSLSRQYQRLNDLKNQSLRFSQSEVAPVISERLSSKFILAIEQKNLDLAFEQFSQLEDPGLDEVLLVAALLFEQDRYELLFSFLYEYRYGLDVKSEQQLLSEIYRYVEQLDVRLGKEENYEKLVQIYRQLSAYQADHTFYYLRLSYWLLQSGDTYEASQSLLGAINDIGFVKEITQLQHAIDLYEKIGPQIEIPLKLEGDHYIVGIELEGGIHLDLMIDTGATKTVVKKALLVDVPGIMDDTKKLIMNTANGRAKGLGTRLSNVNMAKLNLDYLDVVLMELPKFKHDGLLGMNFLTQFDFDIDQENLLLRLNPKKITLNASP